MTAPAFAALVIAAGAAAVDWIAVAEGAKRVEYVAKPLTMAALVTLALLLDPADEARRTWFVAAGVLSLAGDVFLMLPRDRFVPGLVSFLLAHVCYTAGLLQSPLHPAAGLIGLAAVAAAVWIVGRRVLRAVRTGHGELFVPVVGYLAVIATMVVAAAAAGPPLAVAGAALFFTSDSVLALERFVRQTRRGRLEVMVSYHLGQAALVVSLAS